MKKFLFVGERRSQLAKKMKVTWIDGRLAAKQLFDALRENGIDPLNQSYCNLFERGGKVTVKQYQYLIEKGANGEIVALGKKVSSELTRLGIRHTFVFHPAARGKIRKKANYAAHLRSKLQGCPLERQEKLLH